MKCPKCQPENPAGMKFCGERGHPLTQSSEPISKDLTFDQKLERIQKYLPDKLTEKISFHFYTTTGFTISYDSTG